MEDKIGVVMIGCAGGFYFILLYFGEVYCHVFVNQVGLPEWGLAGDVVEQSAGVGIHHAPVR